MEPTETIMVDKMIVGGDGGGGALGHPMVYLTVEKSHHVDCPYCGRRYVLKEGAAAHAH